MNEQSYLYQIIRYVPDPRRMEPQNIGVITQGQGKVRVRLWSHFRPLGDKPNFDFANFRKWREFFESEINGPQIKLFQPPHDSPEFLEYLQSRCKGNYILTRPLQITMRTEDIDEVTTVLYRTVVRSPEEEREPAEQPVRRFREQLQEKKLENNPHLRRDEYVILSREDSQVFRWQYEKNHGTNMPVLIEPIQWRGSIRLTQIELEHVQNAVRKVRAAKFRAQLIVLMDELAPPSPHAKDATNRLYENYLKGREVLLLESDEVISTVLATENLVARIETDLAQINHIN